MKCPGQDSRYWKPGAIFEARCPECGEPVEFFKDDPTRKCQGCGHKCVNPNMDFGCAAYCRFAEQCIGELPPELLAEREELMKDRIAVEMKKYFKTNFKRIGHATRVARHAEEIAREAGGDTGIILAAAYLHEIGSHEALRRHGSTAGEFLEAEGPPIAREIMEGIGAAEPMTEEICDIISRHYHPGKEESINFKIVWDANRIAEMEEAFRQNARIPENLRASADNTFYTAGAKKRADEILRKRAKQPGETS